MENPEATGRISKWASKLRSYGLKYELKTVIKGQVLADFIADFTPGATKHAEHLEGWILNVDGASNSKRAGIGIVLTIPKGSIIEQSFTLSSPAFHNEVEYEAVLAGLRAAITLGVTVFEVQCDSSHIVN